jgi:hypothetical protein
MTNDDAQQDPWKAPYMAYATLANFLDNKIGGGAVPPRIDRPFLDNYAGSVQLLLIATLKTIGLIDESSNVLEPLRVAVRSPESRREVLRSWAELFYKEQIDLATRNATAQMLWESFSRRGFNGSTLRRAVIFYLGLADDLQLPVSAFFKAPKGAPRSAAPDRRARGKGEPSPPREEHRGPSVAPPATAGAEARTIDLGKPGKVTVIVEVRWLDLPDAKFTKLREIIRDLEALDQGADATAEVGVTA